MNLLMPTLFCLHSALGELFFVSICGPQQEDVGRDILTLSHTMLLFWLSTGSALASVGSSASVIFSQLLFKRQQLTPDDNQSADQAGFRPGYSTTNHLFTFQQLRPRATEWHQPLWDAAIDFKKNPSTQWNTATHKAQRPATSTSVHTDVKANSSKSSGEPNRDTHSARSCSTHTNNT